MEEREKSYYVGNLLLNANGAAVIRLLPFCNPPMVSRSLLKFLNLYGFPAPAPLGGTFCCFGPPLFLAEFSSGEKGKERTVSVINPCIPAGQ